MIGVVVRELTYLKALAPIMQQLHTQSASYNLYHFDAPRGDKEYNRATLSKLKKAHPASVQHAKQIRAFANDNQLLSQLIQDKVTKLVSIEIWLWAKGYLNSLKKHNIKTYSILYLTDSLWQDPACITTMDKVYYSSQYLMELHHEFAGIKADRKRDQFLGAPVFDPLLNKPSTGKDILVLLPNLRKEHVQVAFGNSKRFFDMMDKIAQGGNLIFKTRKKQWLPNEIKKYAKEIVEDGELIYPPVIADLLKRCYCTVMFFSSGIYECVYGGNYVYNITFPLKRWGWNKDKMKRYFSTTAPSVYQFPGAVESLEQDTVLGDWKFEPNQIDPVMRKAWVEKYIGCEPCSGAKQIVMDILRDK